MYRYALYTEDDVIEFHSLNDAIAYADHLMHSCQMHSVVIEQATGKVVYST